MSTESLHRTSEIVETPSQYVEAPKRVNVDVLKQRLLEEKKKEKVKRTIILSSVIVSLGALTMLTYYNHETYMTWVSANPVYHNQFQF